MSTNGNAPEPVEDEAPDVNLIITAGALASAVEKGASELDVVFHVIGSAIPELYPDDDVLAATMIGFVRNDSGDVLIGIERV